MPLWGEHSETSRDANGVFAAVQSMHEYPHAQKVAEAPIKYHSIDTAVHGWYCIKKTGFKRPCGTTEREDRRIRHTAVAHCTVSAAEVQAAVGINDTMNSYKSLISRTALSEAPCSLYSIDSKPFMMPVVSKNVKGVLQRFIREVKIEKEFEEEILFSLPLSPDSEFTDVCGNSSNTRPQCKLHHQFLALVRKHIHYSKQCWSFEIACLTITFLLTCLCLYLATDAETNYPNMNGSLKMDISLVYGNTDGFIYSKSPQLSQMEESLRNVLESNKVSVQVVDNPTRYILDYSKKDLSKFFKNLMVGGAINQDRNGTLNLTAWYNVGNRARTRSVRNITSLKKKMMMDVSPTTPNDMVICLPTNTPKNIHSSVCFTTRAIHLELVTDLSADAFIAALKRFISHRGKCSDIYSDCGSNFVGAKCELMEFEKLAKSDNFNQNVSKFLTNNGSKWHQNVPGAPHMCGLSETGIKSTKYHLKRVVGETKLTYEEFETFLTQIEACLNSRPLTPTSNDPNDLSALTPGHFIIGRPLTSIPEPNYVDSNNSCLTRWQQIQNLVQQFWKSWHKEYLTRLQQRPKWLLPTKIFK
ncbi:integrase catalytic domain-containing protein [Trichonephila clavipes]|nr:integrase catalytic domain-containing protein [Trichonephila clavipes]